MNENKQLTLDSLKKSKLSEEERKELPKISKKLSATKQKTREICSLLASSSEEFDPDCMIPLIQELLDSEKYLSRILYSEFSNYLFSLDEQGRGTFDTNAEALLQYVNAHGTEKKIVEFVIRIYDHCQLAKAQIENIDNMLKERIEEAKKNIETESKK